MKGHDGRLRLPAAVVAALALAAHGVAIAQTPPPGPPAAVALNAKCYTPGDPMAETGSGFTASAAVNLSVSIAEPATSSPLGSLTAPVVTAGADGAFTRVLKAPDLMRDADRRELATSAYSDAAGKTASVQWTLSAWDVSIPEWANRATANPRRKMLVDAVGWTNLGPTLYAHYFLGAKEIKAARIGALSGDCRDLHKRVRQFPFKAVKPGRWTVYFSTTASFDKRGDAWIRFRVRVK